MSSDNRVVITDFNMKVPGFTDKNHFIDKILSNEIDPWFENFLLEDGTKISIAEPQIDSASIYYPRKSDLKAMRKEVIIGTYCLSELLNQQKSHENPSDYTLFIGTGLSFDDYSNEYMQIVDLMNSSVIPDVGKEENYENFYPFVPPLLALRALTNALESFGAQYTGIAGSSTTFGNTSASGYYALREGYNKIKKGECDVAIIGCINGGGIFSYFSSRNSIKELDEWKESMCCAFLVLESNNSLITSKRKGLFEISGLFSDGIPPQLSAAAENPQYFSAFTHLPDETYCIFSGGNTEKEYLSQKIAIEEKYADSFSLFPILGSTGTTGLLLSICVAAAISDKVKSDSFGCFESDPFGREFMVTLEKVGV